MELRQLLNALRRWWWLILASAIVAGVTSYFVTSRIPRVYQSRTTLMMGDVSPGSSGADISSGQTLADVFADLATREPVLRSTLEALKLDWDWQQLKGMVSTRTNQNAPILEVSVIDEDPDRAAIIADQIAQQLKLRGTPPELLLEKQQERAFTKAQMAALQEKIKKSEADIRELDQEIETATSRRQIEDIRSRQSALETQVSTWQSTYAQLQANLQASDPDFIKIIEPAEISKDPVGPKTTQNIILAGLVGAALALAVVLLLELVDDTIKTADDARRTLSGVPVLGSVARISGGSYPERLVAASNEFSPIAEAYRVLRTNLQFSSIGRGMRSLMITSSKAKEGKSTTAANLAVVMAQAGKKVILVDADLRRPTQHLIFELDNEQGLTTAFLDEQVNIDQLLKPVTADSLSVLPSGPIPHNPSELLDSERMINILDQLTKKADLVILDSPPVLSVADATILASRVDGVMMVVDSAFTRRGTARRSRDLLQSIGARIVGVVVNRAPTRSESDYYDYRYSPDPKQASGASDKKVRFGGKQPRPLLNPAPATADAKPVKLTKPVARLEKPDANGNSGATEKTQ
jgi:non-specific protein-tyrosine kinase